MAGPLTRAGRYQIVSELGRGSMGVVYQGFDPLIGRTVAIKTMLLEGLSPSEFEEYKARFQREAQAAGVLAHPNIVTVYDFGEDDGVLYLAMELLEGKSLQSLVEAQNVLPVETIIPIFDQVCNALGHAHHRGIVHRDVKPANIMILESGLVKVTDFGIAKVMSMGMTQAGQILGTPNYMSPEQVRGRPVDGRSDIFSLGVILYELVTGEKPFSGQNITTVIYKIINENPISPRELDASIHPGLSYVIQKTLAKNPDERYQTCRELAEDLKNYKDLGGATAPSETVVIRVPPIQAAPEAPPRPARPQPAPRQPPPIAEAQIERKPARPISVQVIPPAAAQVRKSYAWIGIIVVLLVVGAAGAGYYLHLQRSALPQSATLSVNANVDGARIALNGRSESAWLTPMDFSNLKPGWYEVVISREGYEEVRQRVLLEADKTVVVNASLLAAPPPTTGRLEVAANVTGAAISIDGQSNPHWKTPRTFAELAVGPHVVALSKEGFELWEQTVTVDAGGVSSISAELKEARRASAREEPLAPPPPRVGQILIRTNVPGAVVTLDGERNPDWVTPVTIADVRTGRHVVRISKEGYSDAQRIVQVEGGRTLPLEVELGVPSGFVSIVTEPAGVEVVIDGRPYGPSPVETELPAGEHRYAINWPGREPSRGSFGVENGGFKQIRVTMDMRRLGIVEVRTVPPGATVFADGRQMGGKTPTSFRLDAGTHTLTLSMPGHRPLQKTIEVPADGTLVVREQLSPE